MPFEEQNKSTSQNVTINESESKKTAYMKHKEFMRGIIKIENIEYSDVDEQYNLLLKSLPNNGKLYKYRSLCGKSFSHIYDSLKNGYLWVPTADTLNDDFDSIVFDDSINQHKATIDYLCKDEDKLLYFLTKNYGERKWSENSTVSKIPFSKYLSCFNNETYELTGLKEFIDSNFHTVDEKIAALEEIKLIIRDLISLVPRPENFIHWSFERNKNAYKSTHVFSMSENYDLDNMWGYYADSGKGFCVEYDFSLGKNLPVNEKRFLLNTYRVVYSDERSVFDIESFWERFFFENDSDETLIKLSASVVDQVLSKRKCWEHEREWRIAVSECDSQIYVNIVSGIIIDERSLSKSNAIKLISLCKQNNWEIKVRLRSSLDGNHWYLPYDEYKKLGSDIK